MKRILSFFMIFVFILAIFVPVTAFADYELPQYVRIGLYYGAGAVKTIEVSSVHGFYSGTYDGREFSKEAEIDQTELAVEADGDSVIVKDISGNIICEEKGSIGLRPMASGKEQVMNIGSAQYRGGVDCIARDGTLTVVNVVFLDHYLYGVISREMSPSWNQEALKTQAVCARNYAANNLNKHSENGFDLCAAVHCQAYSGTKSETENSYAPVDDTTRQVLTYDNKLAQLYYSSSMGPTTENVENVWGSSIPYLVSVDNSFEDTQNIPNGVWSGTLTCEEASTIMRNKGYDVGDVTGIKVLEYTDTGRVLKMEVTGTNGSKVFEREACRTIFNTVTKSQMFSVSGDGEGGRSVPKVYATDGTDITEVYIDKMTILSNDGRSTLAEKVMYISDGINQYTFEITSSETGANTEFYFEGVGWGHGVGMSQYGAKGMAEAGFGYVEILQHYFPGTNLENAY